MCMCFYNSGETWGNPTRGGVRGNTSYNITGVNQESGTETGQSSLRRPTEQLLTGGTLGTLSVMT